MAANPQITGFDANSVRVGLRLAMTVGLPVAESDRPAFYMPVTGGYVPISGGVVSGAAIDAQGVPFGAGLQMQRPARTVVAGVPCAIEYQDVAGAFGPFGETSPSRVVLTLLDQDYAQVKGFEFCVIGGTRYNYLRTEAPKALVSVGLYRVHCAAEDQG